MITLHLDRTLLLSFLGAEAVAVFGMALFLWWAIRAVDLFRAAAAGKAFADAVEEARASVNVAAARAATQVTSHEEKVLELIQQAAEVSKRLKQVTPQSIQTMVDAAAARKAAEVTAQHAAARKAAEAEAKVLKKLVEALTGSPKALATSAPGDSRPLPGAVQHADDANGVGGNLVDHDEVAFHQFARAGQAPRSSEQGKLSEDLRPGAEQLVLGDGRAGIVGLDVVEDRVAVGDGAGRPGDDHGFSENLCLAFSRRAVKRASTSSPGVKRPALASSRPACT
jgi:hypothetical protein